MLRLVYRWVYRRLYRWVLLKPPCSKPKIQDKPKVQDKPEMGSKKMGSKPEISAQIESPAKVIIKLSLWLALLFSVTFSFSSCIKYDKINGNQKEKVSSKEYQFVCENDGFGLRHCA